MNKGDIWHNDTFYSERLRKDFLKWEQEVVLLTINPKLFHSKNYKMQNAKIVYNDSLHVVGVQKKRIVFNYQGCLEGYYTLTLTPSPVRHLHRKNYWINCREGGDGTRWNFVANDVILWNHREIPYFVIKIR